MNRADSSDYVMIWPSLAGYPVSDGWVAVLVCYLDDSGEYREPFVTLAGLVAPVGMWLEFESVARECFDKIGLEYLHTVDLYHRRNEFKGWNSTQTADFAEGFAKIIRHFTVFSVEFSVLKSAYEAGKVGRRLNGEGSPIGFCMHGIVDRIVKDEGFLAAEKNFGANLSFVVERGNKNDANILARYNAIQRQDPKRFGAISFEDKKSRIALQAADFIAYYSRRIRNSPPGQPRKSDLELFNKVMGDHKRLQFAATSFGV